MEQLGDLIAAIPGRQYTQPSERSICCSSRAAAEAQLNSSKASVSQSQANVNQAQVNLEHTIITSPVDGIVIDTKTSIEVMGIFQQLNRERNITVVLITHEHDIAEYGTRTAAFRDGVVVKDHPVASRRLAEDELQALPAESLT